MRIIIASEVIHPGGAETFILRLARSLKDNGHDAVVFVFYEHMLNYELCKIFAKNVEIVPAEIPAFKLLSKIDSLLFMLKIDYSVRDYYIQRSLRKLIKRHKTELIHSHLLKVDKLCLDVASDEDIPVVNTIHGDYLQFFEKTRNNIPIPLLNYTSKAPKNLKRLAATVVISDKQIIFFDKNFPMETNGKISKIYNGYKAKVSEHPDVLRKQLGITDNSFVFGMVSRGIAEKGWQVAIDAFIKLNNTNAHLVLTGHSDYLSAVKAKHAQHSNIHFTGHSDNPINWINIFNAGLLPSTYPSESLPTVVIEYLFCKIPVIASDAGEIASMTGQETSPAGIIVPIINQEVSSSKVCDAMQLYMQDKATYSQHKANASICYEMFDMDKCTSAYTHVYEKAIKTNS